MQLFFGACQNKANEAQHPLEEEKQTTAKLQNPIEPSVSCKSVLVLIPFDSIANAGISPNTRTMIENMLSDIDGIDVIPFPFKELMGVSYQMVFDKKYCAPIIEVVNPDVIVMTRLSTNNERIPGKWEWHYQLKIYEVSADNQFVSIEGKDLSASEFESDLNLKKAKLISDIKTNN